MSPSACQESRLQTAQSALHQLPSFTCWSPISALYLQQGPACLLPQLHPDRDVVDLWGWRAEVLVFEAGAQEVVAAGFEEVDLSSVVWTWSVSRTECRHLTAYQRGEQRLYTNQCAENTKHTKKSAASNLCFSLDLPPPR